MSNPSKGLLAGIVSKIRVENFMCHSHMEINLADHVNFITGQNGSGKSAILTALCIAFGCRAKSTDRATTLKQFIKTGCSYSLVHVEITNRGEDAFKHDVFGDVIIVERRITESSSTSVLKDQQGKKVATRREDIRELVEHFNIDVENPCVVMSQDKSREFLHSGNDKDKFKFFFKATLLSQVDDLLKSVRDNLDKANGEVVELERSIAPIEKELDELRGKIKSMEHIEEISQQIQLLRKKCAWSMVYDIDKKIQEDTARIKKLEGRIPQCQAKIDQQIAKVADLQDSLNKKKAQSAVLMESTSKAKKRQSELEQKVSKAKREKIELHQEYDRRSNNIAKMERQIQSLQQQISDANEQQIKDTQAEEFEMENKIKDLQDEIRDAESECQRLKNIEEDLSERLGVARDELKNIISELNDLENKANESQGRIRTLRLNQTHKVTAFGGRGVPNLLQVIERNHRRFRKPPIGPIGSHLALTHGDKWAVAVEHAIGKLFNSFIVTDHKDFLLLRSCGREANYHNLKIIIFDFSIPRFQIESQKLPHTHHPTTLSVIQSDSPTVLNVLVDQGHAERQVLVKDYAEGKAVAFDQRIQNLLEVYTLEGHRMFARNGAQTILPPNRNSRTGRLCGSYDDQIKIYERETLQFQEQAREIRGKKRSFEEQVQGLNDELQKAKKQRVAVEKQAMSKNLKLKDLKNSRAAEAVASSESNVDDLQHEISKLRSDINESEILREKIQEKFNEAEAKLNEYKAMFAELCELAKGDFNALEKATHELTQIEEDLSSADAEKRHYETAMQEKVHMGIESAKERLHGFENERKVNYDKASIICPESEIVALGGCGDTTSEQLQAHLKRLKLRHQQESQRHQESIDELRMIYNKKERKILKQQQTYKAFREKLSAIHTALDKRWSKFQRNATLLKRQLTWQFNGHLRKKGVSGSIIVSYEDQKLTVEVKMPQDASSSNVRDTRGLSGGERSFSTLCFALALHEMTEAPFRAMDEFDVFMDAVSRKISLDTIVDFALAQGSQWIFITPHDISMVKNDERIKKQQMAAPRS
ncbi:P-loop containing nucleoside triphosphate hydrolases superfamily protein [Artemisia annua]|uniref:P-loop containing nucleoside triphosphate hydrolases superfamily protein n=1 Tax=Artemisia annua TaxID=35608 RepID=A0A2U1PCA5_ARTAN|nr:P-loop containing nucleoside triphosphate hydrolases superfamily protein [Artemisia annua]